MDELAGSIAFSSAAVRALTAAWRRGEDFEEGGQILLEKREEFFHTADDTARMKYRKGKSSDGKIFLSLQTFVTRQKAKKYFET
ncbi:MAG: hypothetical protein IKL01_01645 [Mailhella sp.]|nr:hypothetical protein [Mailhella sp.]